VWLHLSVPSRRQSGSFDRGFQHDLTIPKDQSEPAERIRRLPAPSRLTGGEGVVNVAKTLTGDDVSVPPDEPKGDR
jgi:hypothetical protein